MAKRIVKTDYEARLVGKPKGTIMDKAEFDEAFESAERAPLRRYDGTGTHYEVTETFMFGAYQLRKGESFRISRQKAWPHDYRIMKHARGGETYGAAAERVFLDAVESGKLVKVTSDAQRRAVAKYRAKNVTQRVISFYPAHSAELAWLDAQPKKSSYVRGLIADDMARQLGLDEIGSF